MGRLGVAWPLRQRHVPAPTPARGHRTAVVVDPLVAVDGAHTADVVHHDAIANIDAHKIFNSSISAGLHAPVAHIVFSLIQSYASAR